MEPRHTGSHWQGWAACVLIITHALAGPAHADDPPPPEADDGSDLEVHGNPQLQDFGYYEPQFRVDQHARVAVRCLGVEGSPSVTARFRIEVDNASERDMDVRASESRFTWSRRARAPEQAPIRPRRTEGRTTIAPGESGKVILHFEPRGHLRPDDFHYLQLQWTVRSSYGARPMRLSTFVREARGDHVRCAYVPHITHPLGPVPRRHRPWR